MAVDVAAREEYREYLKRLRDEIEKKHGKSVDQLREEREKRINERNHGKD